MSKLENLEMKQEHTVKIKFHSEQSAIMFLEWMCESGEQEYWNYCEHRDEDELADDGVVTFNYHKKGEFAKDLEVKTEVYKNFFKGKR